MQLQTSSHAQGMLFSLLGAIETSVSGHHDASLGNALFAKSNHWQSAKEIGGTQMTPLAQSFQTLYNTLEKLSYSFDDSSVTDDLSPSVTTDTPIQTAGYGLDTGDTHLLSGLDSNALESSAIESALPSRSKVAEDVAAALSTSLSAAEAGSSEIDDEIGVLTQGISRQQTSQATASESYLSELYASAPSLSDKLHRLQGAQWFAPESEPLSTGIGLLSQYASSMQSHTPSSLKVNEASWKVVVSQHQPVNAQFSGHQTLNNLTVPTTAESVATTMDTLMTRAASTNLAVEKTLPIEAQRQIYQVVKDKVQLQVDMNTQVARIRFDPPELGRMEMILRIEGDKLTVQMSASATTTREVLMATSERLRHELIAQNSALSEVDVALSQQHHSANPEQYLASFVEHNQDDAYDEASPSVPEYTAYIARV